MIYLIAGNARQAADEARERELSPSEWRYVTPGSLRGARRKDDDELALVGTWWDRRDLNEIGRDLIVAGFAWPPEDGTP